MMGLSGWTHTGRATRHFLLLLCAMHVMLFIDRVNLAAAAETIKTDLGLTNIQLGVAFSAFNYAYAPFQLVGGWDRRPLWFAADARRLRVRLGSDDDGDRCGQWPLDPVRGALLPRHG